MGGGWARFTTAGLCAAPAGIINAELLSWLPRGACIINGARGGHLVEEDLLQALNSGQVGRGSSSSSSSSVLQPLHCQLHAVQCSAVMYPAIRNSWHMIWQQQR